MIFVTVFICVLWIISVITSPKQQVHSRLEDLDEMHRVFDHREDMMEEKLSKRLLRPGLQVIGRVASGLSPAGKRDRLESLLRQAGQTEKEALGRWHLKKFLFGMVFPGVMGVLLYLSKVTLTQSALMAGVFGLLIQFMLTFRLKRKITLRQKSIQNKLPDVLDLVTVSVEAGLSFDGAIDQVIRQMEGPLTDELAIALKEMRMGKSRRDALRSMSQRCNVDDLTTLVGALIQADDLGVSIGGVLRIQSVQMREKRRQRAREKAMKAPIKLLFPLLFFIFPSIFVVLIGPALLQMMEAF